MEKNDILKLETRKQIYQFILKYPGVHISKISKELEIPYTTLKYHLNRLIKHDLIVLQSESKYFRYYVKNKVGNGDQKIMPYLRQKVSLNVILYLLLWVGASQIELSRSLKKHPTTIEFHLKKLIDARIIERLSSKNGVITISRSDNIKTLEYAPVSNEAVYKLKNPIAVYKTLIINKTSFLDNSSVSALMILIEDTIAEKRLEKSPKKTKKPNFNSIVDKGMDYIYEIFPHPYHV